MNNKLYLDTSGLLDALRDAEAAAMNIRQVAAFALLRRPNRSLPRAACGDGTLIAHFEESPEGWLCLTLPVMLPVSAWRSCWRSVVSPQSGLCRSKRTGTMISRQNRKTKWKGASYATPSADNMGHDQKLQHRDIGRSRVGDVRHHWGTLHAVLPLYTQRHQVPHRG